MFRILVRFVVRSKRELALPLADIALLALKRRATRLCAIYPKHTEPERVQLSPRYSPVVSLICFVNRVLMISVAKFSRAPVYLDKTVLRSAWRTR